MSAIVVPLKAHPAFHTAKSEELTGILETQLSAKIAKLPKTAWSGEARANRFKLPQGELWFCSYGTPLSVAFPESDHVRVQFQHTGIGATWVGKELIGVTPTQACISEGATEIDFGADFQQIVWRAPRGVLVQKLSALIGRPITSDLDFAPALDISRPQAETMRHILGCIVDAADTIEGEPAKIVLNELEQAFIVAFLAASTHRYRDALNRRPGDAAPWQVKRAEAYIEAHWNEAITIEDLVMAAGVSARTLFRTFRQSRNCSPLDFARCIRLERARVMLQTCDTGKSVTEIAFACGFGDLSRFSKDFAAAFGELPSAVLKRNRRMSGAA